MYNLSPKLSRRDILFPFLRHERAALCAANLAIAQESFLPSRGSLDSDSLLTIRL
jgi:hypothetical protein